MFLFLSLNYSLKKYFYLLPNEKHEKVKKCISF